MARILIGNIKGPQGPQGEQGIQGPVGPVGPQGPLPPLANNGTTEEVGKAALDAAYGKVLRDAVDQLNRDTVKTKENYLTSPYTITKTDLRTLNGWDPGMFDHIPTELKNQWIACITTSPYDNEISEASCQILIGMSDGTIAFRNGEVDGGKWKEFKVKHWT